MRDRPARPQPGSRSAWEKVTVVAPYLWLIAFFLVPFLIVLKISLSQTAIAQPPYMPVLDIAAGWRGLADFLGALSPANYLMLTADHLYLFSYLRSLTVATVATAILVLAGFPIAYAMARAPRRLRPLLVMLVVLPFWTSFLIRVYAWINILQRDGLLNQALSALGLIDQPVTWLATDTAIYIGLVYSYLPFMILPLYTNLEKHDPTLLEAAADLGARPLRAFLAITLPQSAAGILAGSLLVFIPAVGEYVIPTLLGRTDQLMIGRVLSDEFFENRDWPVASAVAIVVLLLLVVPIILFQRLERRELEAQP
jgi:putrescine transport system permease protein